MYWLLFHKLKARGDNRERGRKKQIKKQTITQKKCNRVHWVCHKGRVTLRICASAYGSHHLFVFVELKVRRKKITIRDNGGKKVQQGFC